MSAPPSRDALDAARRASRAEVDTVVSRVRGRLFGDAAPPKLGRYELGRVLGRGGLSTVYEARDPQLDRAVAIKVLSGSPELERDDQQTRVLREARALARVNHRHIVAVYDSGVSDGRVFVAMELIAGRTLDAWIADAEPSAAEILGCLAQVAEGLVAAHAAGIVHRDIKPRNILIDADGCARIVDFGLARGIESSRAATPGNVLDLQLTATGACIGTPAYMAPEQFEGGIIDARTDQWALCATAWEALTGARPFPGETFEALRDRVFEGPEHRAAPPGISRVTWSAIVRGLARDPAARWPDVASLLAALQPRTRRRWWLLAPIVVGIAGAVTWHATQGDSTEQRASAIAITDLRAAWTTPNQVRWTWSTNASRDALAEYRLITGPSSRDVEDQTAAATVWTSAEIPELGHFIRPLTNKPEEVTAVTTVGHDSNTLVYAQLVATDTHGRAAKSAVAVGRSTPAAVGAVALFTDETPLGYSVPPQAHVRRDAPHRGHEHLSYTATCDAEPCWANLRRQALAQPLTAVTEGIFESTAYLECYLAVDGEGPAWWSTVRLWFGSEAEETIAYYSGFAVPSDGQYHAIQVPLRILTLNDAPLPFDVVERGLFEWGVGGSWRRDARVRVDDVYIRW